MRGDTICPCTPDAAAQRQPIPYTCGAQRALLPIAVDAMNINELMNINDVRESATIFPRPCKLTSDLLTLKVCSWATCVPLLVFLGLCSQFIPDVRNRQTSDSIIATCPRLGSGGIISQLYIIQNLKVGCRQFCSCVPGRLFAQRPLNFTNCCLSQSKEVNRLRLPRKYLL